MRLRPPAMVGMALGLGAALLVIGNVKWRDREPGTGPMLADYGGRVRSVVMQYTAGSEFVWPVYKEFLSQQSPELTVYLVCPEQQDMEELRAAIGNVPPKLIPIFTHHEMTPWSRDRWVALMPAGGQPGENRMTLLAPKGESGQEIWPQRAGDSRVADDLAAAMPRLIRVKCSGLFFDGGDYFADGNLVFATRALFERNIQHTVTSREQLVSAIAGDLNRTVVLMENSPDHHAGMFMMSAGHGRMLVADPSLGAALFDATGPEAAVLEGGADFSTEMQSRFDAVAKIAADNGYAVTRIPAVVPKVGKTYVTYVNGILDRQDGKEIYYMPMFAGQPRLNNAAAEVWKGLGFEVRPIDCSTTWAKGGTLHCLVNVLQRSL